MDSVPPQKIANVQPSLVRAAIAHHPKTESFCNVKAQQYPAKSEAARIFLKILMDVRSQRLHTFRRFYCNPDLQAGERSYCASVQLVNNAYIAGFIVLRLLDFLESKQHLWYPLVADKVQGPKTLVGHVDLEETNCWRVIEQSKFSPYR